MGILAVCTQKPLILQANPLPHPHCVDSSLTVNYDVPRGARKGGLAIIQATLPEQFKLYCKSVQGGGGKANMRAPPSIQRQTAPSHGKYSEGSGGD